MQLGNLTVKCKTCMVENVVDCPKCVKLGKEILRAWELQQRIDSVVKWYCESTVDVFGAGKEEAEEL